MKEFDYIEDLYDNELSYTDWCYYILKDLYTVKDFIFDTKAVDIYNEVCNATGKLDLYAFYEAKENISNFRASHTISTYLLGLIIKTYLSIDMRSLPKVEDKSQRNFKYFWTLIVFYHDVASKIENDSRKDLNKYDTIEKIINRYDIEHSFLEKSKYGEIIKKYYTYKVKERKSIDHGAVGALLFYDRAMKKFYEAQSNGKYNDKHELIYKNMRYSKKYPEYMLLIAETIGRHNLFFSNGNEKLYKKYELYDLITSEDGSHKYSLYHSTDKNSKKQLLYLLCFVDSFEFFKMFVDENSFNISITHDNVKVFDKNVSIKFSLNNSKKSLICKFSDFETFEKYNFKLESESLWLNMDIDANKQDKKIKITLK